MKLTRNVSFCELKEQRKSVVTVYDQGICRNPEDKFNTNKFKTFKDNIKGEV